MDVKTSKYSQFHVTRSTGGAFAPRRSIFIIVIIITGFRFSAAEACDAVMLYENRYCLTIKEYSLGVLVPCFTLYLPRMASNASIVALLRRAAPNLSRHFFQCTPCARKPSAIRPLITPAAKAQFTSTKPTPFLRAFQSRSTASVGTQDASPLAQLRAAANSVKANSPSKSKSRFFPKTTQNAVAYWLLGSAASVFGIVILGGLTRLTESGWVWDQWVPCRITDALHAVSASQNGGQ